MVCGSRLRVFAVGYTFRLLCLACFGQRGFGGFTEGKLGLHLGVSDTRIEVRVRGFRSWCMRAFGKEYLATPGTSCRLTVEALRYLDLNTVSLSEALANPCPRSVVKVEI